MSIKFMLLCATQVNKKTRASAYQLIVDIAHELDDARPLSVSGAGPDSDDDMDYGAAGQGAELSGGLIDFVNAVMAGLVGASPHMQVCQQRLTLHRPCCTGAQSRGVVSSWKVWLLASSA